MSHVAVPLGPAILFALAWVGWCEPLLCAEPTPEVRPISAAERRAAELAVAYLDRGPEAWWQELALSSPLRRLGEAAALDEIAVRAGPPEGARWILQTPAPGSPVGQAVFTIEFPSAIEETLALVLVEESGEWRIRELRCLADPVHLDLDSGPPTFTAPTPDSAGVARFADGSGKAVLAVTLLLLGLTWLSRTWVLGGRSVRQTAAWGIALSAVAIGIGACDRGPRPTAQTGGATVREQAAAVASMTRLGALRDLRWTLAAGSSALAAEELTESAPPSGPVSQVASLWWIETQLWSVDVRAADALLEELPTPSPVPLGDLLRARLATVRGNLDAVREHYERALDLGIDHDGLRIEYAEALATLGESVGAGVTITQLAEMGSRLADTHYARAQFSVLDGEPDRGASALAVAWRLEPVLREELLIQPLLASLCARPSLFPSFSFDSPEEPLVEAQGRGVRPIRLPPAASADLAGELLRVESGNGELFVPGGAELAPASVRLETAADRNRREEDRTLGRLPELIREARTPAVLTRPRRTRQVVEAAFALARRNRWQEVIELSEGMAQVVDLAPSPVVQLRAAALERDGRTAEARSLLVRLAQSSVANRRRDPGTLHQLAELLVTAQEYERAIRLMRKAAALTSAVSNDHRIRQVAMEQRLYEAPRFHQSRHFELVYPHRTVDAHAEELGAVLEAELARLSHWIPAPAGVSHTVHLYPLVEFLEAYSGGALVLGLYDGRLRVPFADVRSLHPRLVAVLSHELAHAMLAEATGDQAPKWFHEGLAQHVEMVTGRVNPIPDLHRTGRVLAFPMIEAILDGFGEAQLVELAYGEAAWVVHYIEAEHGVGAIRRLIESFRAGRTTEEALQEVLGLSVPELDRAFRGWCLGDAPMAWQPPERRRYEDAHNPYVRAAESRKADGHSGRDLDRAEMRSWHGLYTGRTLRLKQLLGRVVEPIRAGDGVPAGECRALAREASAALEDGEALESPDPAVREQLALAFENLETMALACEQGDRRAAAIALARAEIGLSRAAASLGAYGLRP